MSGEKGKIHEACTHRRRRGRRASRYATSYYSREWTADLFTYPGNLDDQIKCNRNTRSSPPLRFRDDGVKKNTGMRGLQNYNTALFQAGQLSSSLKNI